MRRNIIHIGAGSLHYAIREIVSVAKQFEKLGVEITWENIGDPIHKGEKVQPWIKNIIKNISENDRAWGYGSTVGVRESREFLASQVNARGGTQITSADIIFFNGLGDAVAKIYGFLRREARIIGPTPAYSTHSSAEAAHSGYEHLTYELDPYNNWLPNIKDLALKVKYNDSIAGILLINPDNPTGIVYSRKILESIVEIARTNDIFIICDEIYANIVYNGCSPCSLSEVIGDVCGISLRGISKEYPWPGSRCGWIEVLNRQKDPLFDKYIDSLIHAKMLEVCSTVIPQLSIPLVMGDPRYAQHIAERAKNFEKRSNEAFELLKDIKGIKVNRACGAFYMTVMFEEGVLNKRQYLPIKNPKVKYMVKEQVTGADLDTRFVYYLLGSTGICVVPLSGFYCRKKGFRVTLLEVDDKKRKWIFKTLAKAIEEYLASV
ncbi:MAG: pyridoxal phosphate-dependent aminotransferase [bacterium]